MIVPESTTIGPGSTRIRSGSSTTRTGSAMVGSGYSTQQHKKRQKHQYIVHRARASKLVRIKSDIKSGMVVGGGGAGAAPGRGSTVLLYNTTAEVLDNTQVLIFDLSQQPEQCDWIRF